MKNNEEPLLQTNRCDSFSDASGIFRDKQQPGYLSSLPR